jgi:putative NADH-flavin reductase
VHYGSNARAGSLSLIDDVVDRPGRKRNAMKITIFGATGALGSECLLQALELGYDVTVLVRSQAKLPADLPGQLTVIEGDALNQSDVATVLSDEPEAILFAIGVDKQSPEDLCTDITRMIIREMNRLGIKKFVWCGGGSTLVEEDQITIGARMVEKIAQVFLSLRHNDKEHQYQFLRQHPEIQWSGVRPLQMRSGPKTSIYRLGFEKFNGFSWISFADCAHAMLRMLADETWVGRAPIIQY